MEELNLNLEFEDLDEVVKQHGGTTPFPALCISSEVMCYSIRCNELIEHWDGVAYYLTTDYLILRNGNGSDKAFSLTPHTRYATVQYTTTFPAALKHKGFANGVYKLYKFKDGYAIKKAEPLKRRGQ